MGIIRKNLPAGEECPLCAGPGREVSAAFFACAVCRGVFKRRELLLSPDEEKKHYLTHNNDVEDVRYQKFVSPIVAGVCDKFPLLSCGLDFGAGTGPVITRMLRDRGYEMEQYDPFFSPDAAVLQQRYDFIACCEVVEHFYRPATEFLRLRQLLRPSGSIFVMTLLYDENVDFSSWFYIKDETHVFLYCPDTFAWIKENFGFSGLQIEKRLIRLDV